MGRGGRRRKERCLVLADCCLLGLAFRNPPHLCSIFFYFLSALPLQGRSVLCPLLSVWGPQN